MGSRLCSTALRIRRSTGRPKRASSFSAMVTKRSPGGLPGSNSTSRSTSLSGLKLLRSADPKTARLAMWLAWQKRARWFLGSSGWGSWRQRPVGWCGGAVKRQGDSQRVAKSRASESAVGSWARLLAARVRSWMVGLVLTAESLLSVSLPRCRSPLAGYPGATFRAGRPLKARTRVVGRER